MNVVTIAGVTLREALRRRLQVNLLLFALVLLLGGMIASSLTVGNVHRITSDLGLSAMELMGTLIAVFLGASLVAGDIERRALYPVVAKPVTRTEYLLGRYLGLCATLVLNLAAMALVLSILMVIDTSSFAVLDRALLAAFAMMGVQFMVIAAVAVLFSAVTTPTLASIFGLSVAIAGHMANDLRTLWRGGGAWLGKALWYLLPNLSALSQNEAVIYGTPPPAGAWLPCLYAVLYAAALLGLASVAFEQRDFK